MSQHNKTCKGGKKNKKTKGGIHEIVIPAIFVGINNYFKKSKKNSEFNFEKAYKELSNQNLNMRESGCLSLDLSYVGAGRLDGVWGYDVSLIDFAAGALIAQEGGALASNFNGDPKFLMENNIISATSKIYKSILKSIKPNYTN